ncbi:MAG: S1 family peptidase [Candidatus Bathyarchaeota archaeon]|nr:S1 family peptidase [Candidatus Bathyarchaeota archaeon]
MKLIKVVLLTTLSAVFLLSMFSSPVYGVTGNFQPDSTSYVGIVVLFSDTAREVPVGYCTGFLISPRVMVTAGHSCVGVAAVSVCFDSGPISYTLEDGKIISSTTEPIYNGIPIAYPGYLQGLIAGNRVLKNSDVGIIVLDEPVTSVTSYASLPEPCFVDELPVKTSLKVVGYGAQYQTRPKNNDPANSWIGSIARSSAQVNLLSVNFAESDRYIKCSANSAQSKGGVAYGDSGGPVIYTTNEGQETVIAINAYVSNANCAGVTYHTRIDNPLILAWIKGFLNR